MYKYILYVYIYKYIFSTQASSLSSSVSTPQSSFSESFSPSSSNSLQDNNHTMMTFVPAMDAPLDSKVDRVSFRYIFNYNNYY